VVHEPVDRSDVVRELERVLDRLRDALRVPDVEVQGPRGAALGAQLARDLDAGFLAPRRDEHGRSLARKPPRDRLADAAPRSGDEGDVALLHARSVPRARGPVQVLGGLAERRSSWEPGAEFMPLISRARLAIFLSSCG